MALPVLYSYRRCPYAMRARMALHYAGVVFETREIVLRDKPQAMLQASPKGTVPVLVLPDACVLEQSLQIMHWALAQRDTGNWLLQGEPEQQAWAEQLIASNDSMFKQALDRYKYAERFPEQAASTYRAQCELFLQQLETSLQSRAYLCAEHLSWADIAIFPFIRQFAAVDMAWFDSSPYLKLQAWLLERVQAPLFTAIMQKHPVWVESLA